MIQAKKCSDSSCMKLVWRIAWYGSPRMGPNPLRVRCCYCRGSKGSRYAGCWLSWDASPPAVWTYYIGLVMACDKQSTATVRTVHICSLSWRTEVQGNVSKMALCAVVNINFCLVERSVAMVIVTILSWNVKTIFRLICHWQYGKELNLSDVRDVLKSNDNDNNGNLPSPSWHILWDAGALGGVPVVYCYADVVSEHPFWLCVCLSFCVSVCSCLALCSLAEDEVKTEADVVEGMDASVRSKGKSLRPSSSHYEPNIFVVFSFRECGG